MRRVTAADLVAIVVVIIWGGSYPIVKSVYAEVTPLAFTMLRFVVASLLLLPLVVAGWRRRAPRLQDWPVIAAIGLLTVTVYQTCFSIGLSYTSASHSSLIVGSAPVFTLAYAYLFRLETPSWTKTVGILLALAGLFLLIGGGGGLGPGHLLGDVITVGSAMSYGISAAISRPVIERLGAPLVMGLALAIGTAGLAPFAGAEMLSQDWLALSSLTWLKFGYAAVLAASLSYVAWFWCIGRIGATRTAAFGYFIPVTAVALSVAWYGEALTAMTAVGAGIVLAGVALVRWGETILAHSRRRAS